MLRRVVTTLYHICYDFIIVSFILNPVHIFMQLFFFSKVRPACHNIANGNKPGSNSKKTDTHAMDCSKALWCGVKYFVGCINCEYNNEAKGIRLLDKKAFFVYIGQISFKIELLKDISPYICYCQSTFFL